MFRTEKVYDGFSTVFRQHKAHGTHCKFLHGYAVKITVGFKGELDYRNWVFDFGGMKRTKTTIDDKNPKEWLNYMFDHTTIVAEDDPELDAFKDLEKRGVIQLRILKNTGAERFAEYIFHKLSEFIKKETDSRVSISYVIFSENSKNSAVVE